MKNFLRLTALAICAIFMVSNASAQDNYNATTMGEIVRYYETAKWGQQSPFNNQIYTEAGGSTHGAAGCVPTAYAIIMRYWGFPTEGTSSDLQNCQTGESITDRTYDWSKMPLTNGNGWTEEQKNEVSKLFAHVLHAVVPANIGQSYTDANEGGSTAYLETHFGYTNISSSQQWQHTKDAWEAKMKESLDNGCPIPYASKNTGTGDARHMFVIDGYTTEGYYHINFGWNGYANGWHKLDEIKPADSDGNLTGDNYSWVGDATSTSAHKAFFNLAPKTEKFTVTATADPATMGTVSINGGTAGTTASAEINENFTATLTAHPAQGYALASWTKNGEIVGTKNTLQVKVGTSDNDYVANFDNEANVYVTKDYIISPSTVGLTGSSKESVVNYQTSDEYPAALSLASTATNGTSLSAMSRIDDDQIRLYAYDQATSSTTVKYTLSVPDGYQITEYKFDYSINKTDYPCSINYSGGTVSSPKDTEWHSLSPVVVNAKTAEFTISAENAHSSSNFYIKNFIVTVAKISSGGGTGGSTPTTKTYTINVSTNPGTAGTVKINEEAVPYKSVNENSTVTLVATPSTGYSFVNWTDANNGSEVSDKATYSYTATSDKSLVANFEQTRYTVTVAAGEGGSAYIGTKGTTQATATYNGNVTITAEAASGYRFVEWRAWNNRFSSNAEENVTVTTDVTYTAVFEPEAAEPELPITGTEVNATFAGATGFVNQGYTKQVVLPATQTAPAITFSANDAKIGHSTVEGTMYPYLFKGTNFTISVPSPYKIAGYKLTVQGHNFNAGTFTYTVGTQNAAAAMRTAASARSNTATATISEATPLSVVATGLNTSKINIGVGDATAATAGIIVKELQLDLVQEAQEPEQNIIGNIVGINSIPTEKVDLSQGLQTGYYLLKQVNNNAGAAGGQGVGYIKAANEAAGASATSKNTGTPSATDNRYIWYVEVVNAESNIITISTANKVAAWQAPYQKQKNLVSYANRATLKYHTGTVNLSGNATPKDGSCFISNEGTTAFVHFSGDYLGSWNDTNQNSMFMVEFYKLNNEDLVQGYLHNTSNINREDRKLNSFTITDGTQSLSVTDIQTSNTAPVYVDKSDLQFTTSAGATLKFSGFNWSGSSMHAYAYIDYNKDYKFELTNNNDGSTNGEIVSYNYYNETTITGANSNSATAMGATYNGSKTLPGFTLPRNLPAGEYRMRIKVDWNNLDADYGASDIAGNGGCQCDITLVIKEEFTVTVTASEGGTAIASAAEVVEGDNVTLTATADSDHRFVGWYNGETKVSEANPYTFAVTSNINYEARFGEPFPDGAYKIYWQADNRGYLAYHATDYPNEAKLAGVTLSGFQNLHYAVNQVDLVWYLITASDGKRYLFEVATGKFLGVDTSVQANGTGNKLSTTEAWAIAVEPNTNSTRLGHYIITTMINGTKNLLCSGCGTEKTGHPVRWLVVNDNNQKDGGAPLQLVKVDNVTVADNVMSAVRAVIEPRTFKFQAVVDGWRNDNPNTHLGTITIGGTAMKLTPAHQTASELTMPLAAGTTLELTRKYRGFEFNGFYIGSTKLGETLTAENVAAINETTPLVAKFTATEDVTLFYDDDTYSYRIPAIAKTGTNRLVAVSDYRHSLDDIGRDNHHTGTNRVDLVMRTSDDNGATWSAKQTIAEGTSTFGYGDAAIVANGEDILVMAVAGNVFYPNATATDKNKTYRIYSNNNGKSWTKEEVTSNIFGLFDEAYATFFGSGKLAVDPNFNGTGKARVYGAILLKNSARSTNNYVLFSDDWGATWKILGGSKTHIAEADEPKVEILPNGQILLSSRHKDGGSRVFNVFTYGNDKTAGEGTWGTAVSGCSNGGSNGTNGEIICLDAKRTNGKPTKILLQSQPKGGSNTWDRKDVTIWYKEIDNETQTPSSIASDWTKGLQVSTVQSAYSAMALQENGEIAFFFEEAPCYGDDNTKGYSMVYVPLTIEEITKNNFLNPNADVEYVPVEFNIVLTDAQGNEYRETLDDIPGDGDVAAVESYLTGKYPFITLGTKGAIADNTYTNTVTLPFKVSNANTTVWHNIYWPSNTRENDYPVYLSASSKDDTYVPKVTDSYAYGDHPTYNTKSGNDKISWAIYNVNNGFEFIFKNKVTDKYIQVTNVATGNDQNVVYVENIKDATAFTIFNKPAGDDYYTPAQYALAAKVGETTGYLCSTSATGYNYATHYFNSSNNGYGHQGAWFEFVEADYESKINDLNKYLDDFFGEDRQCVINNDVQTIITALESPNNITLNTLDAYASTLDDAFNNWPKLTIVVDENAGSVTINNETRKTKKAPSGYEFTVVATPANGYRFTHWSNGTTSVSTDASYTFNMDAATELTANFEEVSAAYPEVSGNTYSDNYLTSVTTQGGITNVNHLASSHPGVKVVKIGTVQICRGESFTMNLVANSLSSNTSAVHEDMRYCHASLFTDFDGDRTFQTNAIQTWGNKPPTNNVAGNYSSVMNITHTITVPDDAAYGKSHVRMIYTNAWTNWPTNGTATLDKGIVYDIVVEVVEKVTITVGVATENTGTVTINDEATSTKQVVKSSNVTVKATPADGYRFVNWTDAGGNEVSTEASYTFTASENTSLVANFEADVVYHTITVSKYYDNKGGTVKVGEEDATSVNVIEGKSVRMVATVNDGYEFMGWLKDGVIVKNAIDGGLDFEVQGPDYTLYEVKASAEYKAVFSKITDYTNLEDGKAYRICAVSESCEPRYIYRKGTELMWKNDDGNFDDNSIFVVQKNGNSVNLISAIGYHGWKASNKLGNDEQYNPYAAIKVTYGTKDETRSLYLESGTSSGIYTTLPNNVFAFMNTPSKNSLPIMDADNRTTNFLFEEVDTYAFQVSAADGSNAKLGTVNLPFATTVPAEVTVYGVENSEDDKVYMAELVLADNVLPANTPVLIQAEAEGKYGFKPAPASNVEYETGFAGTLEAEEIPGTTNAYILSYKGVGTHIMLYKLSSSSTKRTINANKAYFIDTTGKASTLRFVFGETTDIDDVEREDVEDTIYDLKGRKLSEITEPGFYIVNGKKIFVK